MLNLALFSGQASLVELNDLKRIVSAGRAGSIATRLFGEAWCALVAGAASAEVAWWITARALAATRLGDIDRFVMVNAGLSAAASCDVMQDAVDGVLPGFAAPLKPALRRGLGATFSAEPALRPDFVTRLAGQPRAGITCPGKPRILLEPPENHADHCLLVAVYGVLLAPVFDADPGRVFLAALAHHLHNAGMPDSGFAGETLLGPHLETLTLYYTGQCLSQLAPPLREAVEDARAILPEADAPDGRAFHAADVIDRVLQTIQYRRAGAMTADQMLGEMELVHAGPVKVFQDDVLRQVGLL